MCLWCESVARKMLKQGMGVCHWLDVFNILFLSSRLAWFIGVAFLQDVQILFLYFWIKLRIRIDAFNYLACKFVCVERTLLDLSSIRNYLLNLMDLFSWQTRLHELSIEEAAASARPPSRYTGAAMRPPARLPPRPQAGAAGVHKPRPVIPPAAVQPKANMQRGSVSKLQPVGPGRSKSQDSSCVLWESVSWFWFNYWRLIPLEGVLGQ